MNLSLAPAATKYADFAPPDPLNFAASPDAQFVLNAQQKAIEHSAASRGSYFTPNTMFSLQANAKGNALGAYGDAFNHALQTYGANRDTAQQYFGDQTQQFGGDLAATNAGNAQANADRNFTLAQTGQQFAENQATDATQYDRSIYANNTAYDRSMYADNRDYARGTGKYAPAPGMPGWVDPNAAQNAAALQNAADNVRRLPWSPAGPRIPGQPGVPARGPMMPRLSLQ